jgi:hypothetical protein
MSTEYLHQTLSPQAYAALFDALRGRAEREHRTAVQRIGAGWSTRLRALARPLAARRVHGAPVVHLMEG